jgi:hypothetical protein
MSGVEVLEREALLNITRAVALVCVSVSLLANYPGSNLRSFFSLTLSPRGLVSRRS